MWDFWLWCISVYQSDLPLRTTRKSEQSIQLISLKATEIHQGREDLKGQNPEKREGKHKRWDQKSAYIFSLKQPTGSDTKEAENLSRTFYCLMELGRQNLSPDLSTEAGPWQILRVTPEELLSRNKKSQHK